MTKPVAASTQISASSKESSVSLPTRSAAEVHPSLASGDAAPEAPVEAPVYINLGDLPSTLKARFPLSLAGWATACSVPFV